MQEETFNLDNINLTTYHTIMSISWKCNNKKQLSRT